MRRLVISRALGFRLWHHRRRRRKSGILRQSLRQWRLDCRDWPNIAGRSTQSRAIRRCHFVRLRNHHRRTGVVRTRNRIHLRLELPPGRHTLRFSAANYLDAVVSEVLVTAGATVDASTVMASRSTVTRVEVVEKISAVTSTAEVVLAERKLAPVVSDSLSAYDLKGGSASDAAGALEKVTGVSIVENGLVFVRGLGERYSATMLNNAIIDQVVREQIQLADLPTLSKAAAAAPPVTSPDTVPALGDVERELILKALAVFKDDKEAAAKALGISRRTIYRRLKEYGRL